MNKMILVLIFSSFSTFAIATEFESNFSDGTIELKSGEVLQGMVAPLADYPKSNVLFKAPETQKAISLKHHNIQSIEKNGKKLIPFNFQWENKSVKAYKEEVLSGTFKLYKAHFYAPLQRGKNNSSFELQNSWLIYSPIKGFIVLGKTVKSSTLSDALQHPNLHIDLSQQILNEQELVEIIKNHNEKIVR